MHEVEGKMDHECVLPLLSAEDHSEGPLGIRIPQKDKELLAEDRPAYVRAILRDEMNQLQESGDM